MKVSRQKKIQEIIESRQIETQSELALELKKQGFQVTQATISRDIKELGLIKIPTGPNSSKYSMPIRVAPGNMVERMKRMFRDNVIRVDFSENLIVIRTLPGSAQAVASCIDHMEWEEILGTVAGDDTILLIIKPKEAVTEMIEKLEKLMK